MTWKNCAAAVREAAGQDLTDDQVIDLFERAQLRQRAIQASGAIDGLDVKLREAVQADADALAVQAALARKHAALAIVARNRLASANDTLIDQPGMTPRLIGNAYRNAVLTVFEGTTRGVLGGRDSVAATKLAYEGSFIGDAIMGRIVREVPHVEKMLRDEAFLDDVVREMSELREGGSPGRTGNRDAQTTAKIFADAAEASRVDLNRLGANIGKLDGWAGSQMHNSDRIATAGKDAWIDGVLPRLDLARTFPDVGSEADVRRILGNVWDNIVFGPDRGPTKSDATGSGFKGPVNVARALERHRVLHFASADAWLAYNRDFGMGHIFDGMVAHQSRAALNASQMDRFGPNPGAVVDAELERLRRKVDNDDRIPPEKKEGIKAGLYNQQGTEINKAFRVASGDVMIPHSQFWADIGGGIRAAQSMAKLGGAVISSLSDLATAIVNLRFNGLTFGEAVTGQLGELMRGRGRAEQRELAYLLGEGFDGIIGHLTSPYVANDSAPGAMQRAMTTFFRVTGLSLWQDANRAAAARVLSAHLGKNADTAFDALNDRMRNVLGQHGITPEVWDVMRTEGRRVIDGKTYLVPGFGNRDVDMAMRRYIADEAQSTILEASAASQRYITQGHSRGTLMGEALRFIMQFKAFPITFTERVLGRATGGGVEGANAGAAHIGTLIVGMTVMGYLADSAKQYLRMNEPKELLDDNGNPRMATILAALAQGGGAGLYGDFLFGQFSRTGNSPVGNLVGPLGSDIEKIWRLYAGARDGDPDAGDALGALISSTPFANVWFARPALDYLILNELREMFDPGALSRQDQRRRRDFGQEPLMAPSERMLDVF
ncbi:structural protein [uncultured Caudovirales phage]|uniref:Structural protein n=1 Tax=uncultured Caudovirales phage TaxID=2100421 RepID=A0A6J7X6F5_9CAUD|nr:structural protein [uncultured Caudovirales phage]CAB5225397.1 structural protein [uncultured Caudovirales phage]